jgi:hypothetical protein
VIVSSYGNQLVGGDKTEDADVGRRFVPSSSRWSSTHVLDQLYCALISVMVETRDRLRIRSTEFGVCRHRPNTCFSPFLPGNYQR